MQPVRPWPALYPPRAGNTPNFPSSKKRTNRSGRLGARAACVCACTCPHLPHHARQLPNYRARPSGRHPARENYQTGRCTLPLKEPHDLKLSSLSGRLRCGRESGRERQLTTAELSEPENGGEIYMNLPRIAHTSCSCSAWPQPASGRLRQKRSRPRRWRRRWCSTPPPARWWKRPAMAGP